MRCQVTRLRLENSYDLGVPHNTSANRRLTRVEELEGFSGYTRFNPRAFSGSDQSHRQNGSPCKPGLKSNKRIGIDFNTRSSIGARQTDAKHRCTHTTAHCECVCRLGLRHAQRSKRNSEFPSSKEDAGGLLFLKASEAGIAVRHGSEAHGIWPHPMEREARPALVLFLVFIRNRERLIRKELCRRRTNNRRPWFIHLHRLIEARRS